jgi:formylglycine-generating enzyme required for sulfatase activity
MWEWNLDWHGGYIIQRNDCANLQGSSARVVRGGSWNYGASDLLSSIRANLTPAGRNNEIGARCTRTQ